MEKVYAKLLIKFQSDADNYYLKFSSDWNFSIGDFQFSFIDEDSVQVSFEFSAELVEKEPSGQMVHIIPSEENREFQEKKDELDVILDLLSLSTGHAIKIKTGSVTLSASGIESSNPVENTKVVLLPDIDGVNKRFVFLQTQKNEGLYNGLRAYRMALSYEDSGEKIVKLWSVIEQLYSKSGGRLFTDEEYSTLKKLLEEWKELPKNKREILLKRVKDTPETSPMDSITKKVKLMNEEGHLSAEQVRALLNEWRSKRSSTAHGTRASNREEVDDVLWDIEGTVETLIGSQIYPKMIGYLIFQEADIKKEFLERQGFLVSKLESGYCAYAIKHDELELYKSFLPNEITSSTANVYIVSHNDIHRLSKTSIEKIALTDVESSLKVMIEKVQRKISEDNTI